MILESPFAAALNRLLEREEWARHKLAPFAGEALELRGPPLPALRFTILPGGTLQAGGTDAGLVVTLKPDILLAAMRGEEHVLRSVDVSGNARLASEVMLLVRHLRWDLEEDLSRLVGDAAAHRLAQAGRDFVAWQADAAQRLAQSFADYATEEKRVLVRRRELSALGADVASLRDALERLAKRIDRLG